jgi:hypothetical protein
MAIRLSTPVAYITQGDLPDPFGILNNTLGQGNIIILNSSDNVANVLYQLVDGSGVPAIGTFNITTHGVFLNEARWSLSSRGPDRIDELRRIADEYGVTYNGAENWGALLVEFSEGGDGIYDPTNGTLSKGETLRNARGFNGGF